MFPTACSRTEGSLRVFIRRNGFDEIEELPQGDAHHHTLVRGGKEGTQAAQQEQRRFNLAFGVQRVEHGFVIWTVIENGRSFLVLFVKEELQPGRDLGALIFIAAEFDHFLGGQCVSSQQRDLLEHTLRFDDIRLRD